MPRTLCNKLLDSPLTADVEIAKKRVNRLEELFVYCAPSQHTSSGPFRPATTAQDIKDWLLEPWNTGSYTMVDTDTDLKVHGARIKQGIRAAICGLEEKAQQAQVSEVVLMYIPADKVNSCISMSYNFTAIGKDLTYGRFVCDASIFPGIIGNTALVDYIQAVPATEKDKSLYQYRSHIERARKAVR